MSKPDEKVMEVYDKQFQAAVAADDPDAARQIVQAALLLSSEWKLGLSPNISTSLSKALIEIGAKKPTSILLRRVKKDPGNPALIRAKTAAQIYYHANSARGAEAREEIAEAFNVSLATVGNWLDAEFYAMPAVNDILTLSNLGDFLDAAADEYIKSRTKT